jgi:hypothetical protein
MIVAKQRYLPKIILIESNVLSRAVDTELIENFSRRDQENSQLIRPIRSAVAIYENWNHAPMDQRRALVGREELLRQPPSGFDNRACVDRAVHQLSEESPIDGARSNVEQLNKLIEVVEKRGSRVFLS